MKTICNLADFFDYVREITESSTNMIFRGVEKSDYQLIPSVERLRTKKNNKTIATEDERLMLKLFKQKGVSARKGPFG